MEEKNMPVSVAAVARAFAELNPTEQADVLDTFLRELVEAQPEQMITLVIQMVATNLSSPSREIVCEMADFVRRTEGVQVTDSAKLADAARFDDSVIL